MFYYFRFYFLVVIVYQFLYLNLEVVIKKSISIINDISAVDAVFSPGTFKYRFFFIFPYLLFMF